MLSFLIEPYYDQLLEIQHKWDGWLISSLGKLSDKVIYAEIVTLSYQISSAHLKYVSQATQYQ